MKSLFKHKEIFLESIDTLEVVEIEDNVYQDNKGKIYAFAFGGEKYVKYEDINDYKSKKGKIIYFAIGETQSSFMLIDKVEINNILDNYKTIKIVKKYNDIEKAFLLENNDIIMINSASECGWLFKNVKEMELINL